MSWSTNYACIAATWSFGGIGVQQAVPLLLQGYDAISAVETAIKTVELDNKDQYFVGLGGYPNAAGTMQLDAAIMDHQLHYGAVMAMDGIATPISVARSIMEKVSPLLDNTAKSHLFYYMAMCGPLLDVHE